MKNLKPEPRIRALVASNHVADYADFWPLTKSPSDVRADIIFAGLNIKPAL
ncbi:MAG: hypothetical protein ACQEV6_13675 [Pseudomonadota bacterium]